MKDKTVRTIWTGIFALASSGLTILAQMQINKVNEGNVNIDMFTSREEQICYATAVTSLELIYKNAIGIASKTCKSGNTFFVIEYPDGKQKIRWYQMSDIVSVGKTANQALAAELKDVMTDKNGNLIIYIKIPNTNNYCLKQIINRRTGEIMSSTKVLCPN